MISPFCSVVIPVYNGEKYITEAIRSALAQTFVDIEVIVVDDGSSDSSRAIINEIAQKDSRVVPLFMPKNGGVCEARNAGVARARGEWVAFLDADDCWLPQKLERQFAALRETSATLCCTGAWFVSSDGAKEKCIGVPTQIEAKSILRGNSIITSSVVAKTEVLRCFPMERPDLHEDLICWYNLLGQYGDAVGVNEPLLRYRLTPDSKSRDKVRAAWVTYKTYRYIGVKTVKAVWLFCGYALHGIRRYYS